MAVNPKLYLSRYAYQGPLIETAPNPDLEIIIVIPCYDEPDIFQTLNSLVACTQPNCSIEVIVVINHPENSQGEVKTRSNETHQQILAWSRLNNTNNLSVYPVFQGDLPAKHAGVGLARKIGMDEAVWRFHNSGKDRGMIVNLDADCTCRKDYLEALYVFKSEHPDFSGCSIYFEHPFEDLRQPLRSYIVDYELHLRYHVFALDYAAYPYPYQTVGSSMAVSLAAYVKHGGMNKRKAGEDFYFLHKIFPMGNFHRLNTTIVYPRARYSSKVPFGTGAALNKMDQSKQQHPFRTYNWASYKQLKILMEKIDHLHALDRDHVEKFTDTLPSCLNDYLTEIKAAEKICEIQSGVKTRPSFRKAFFRWFDGLKVLQFLNYSSRNCFPDQDISQAVSLLVHTVSGRDIVQATKEELLAYLRNWERSLDP
jgi:hypothetical protein